MENSFTHNLVNMGGGIMSTGPESTMCKAFEAAVEKWCKDGAGNRTAEFNDYYFDALKGTHPPEGMQLAAQMEREAAMLAHRGDPTARLRDLYKTWKRELEQMTRRGTTGPAREAVDDLLRRLRGAIKDDGIFRSKIGAASMGYSAYRKAVLDSIIGKHALLGVQVRFPDGMLNGYPVELKGPKDNWNDDVSPWSGRDQKGDYQAIRQDGAVIEVSCESCQHPCHAAGNRCP